MNIEEVINRLTNNGQHGTSICLALYISDNLKSIHYLDYLNITGKELEALDECCKNESIRFLVETIRFLRSGFLGIEEIKENLNSDTPIPFIPRLLINGEDWETAYEDFAFKYRKQMKNKGRKNC